MAEKRHRQYVAEQIAGDPEFAVEYARAKAAVQFGVNLAMVRQSQGLTQHALSERAGIKQPMLARYESGQIPSVPTLQRLASALHARVIVAEDSIRFEPAAEDVGSLQRAIKPRRAGARLMSV